MKVKNFITILLCCLMLFSTSAAVFAETNSSNFPVADSYDLTISELKGATNIDLYRVVGITKSGDNLAYNLNSKYNDVYDELGVDSVADIQKKTNAAILSACQNNVLSKIAPDKTQSVTGDSYTFTNIDMGYYYIVMTGPNGTVFNPILVTVPTIDDTGYVDGNVVAKAHDPGIVKEVKEGEDWGDKANADIGDIVDFKLTVDVPKYAPNVVDANVNYVLIDEMSAGLTWLEDEAVVVKGYTGSSSDQGTAITAPFKEAPAIKSSNDGTTLTMKFDYAKIKNYAYITVGYKASLNGEAVVGATGNVNKAYFVYSDNAYDLGDTNTDPDDPGNPNDPSGGNDDWDTTTVYTYGLIITKAELGNDNILLKGAEFELKKDGDAYKFIKNNEGTYTAVSPDSDVIAGVLDVVESDDNGRIVINGLDEGEYVLTETQAPDNYFVVEKNIDIKIDAEKTPALTGYVITGENTENEATVKGYYFEKTVYNSTRFVLPVTGDKGLLLMMVCGITMIAAAYTMFMMRRRGQRS